MNSTNKNSSDFQVFLKDKNIVQTESKITSSDFNQLIIEGASSLWAERMLGLWIAILSLVLPFNSDLFIDPDSTNIFGSYDFYNHEESILLRSLTFLPGLYVFLFYRKNTQCVLNKNTNTFLVNQKYNWKTLQSEGNLEEISGVEIFSIENSDWRIFQRSIFTNMLVRLLKHSGESVSFTFAVQRNDLDAAIILERLPERIRAAMIDRANEIEYPIDSIIIDN